MAFVCVQGCREPVSNFFSAVPPTVMCSASQPVKDSSVSLLLARYQEDAFDAVIDKGTLDALMSEDTPEIRKTGSAMLREVARVIRPGGR